MRLLVRVQTVLELSVCERPAEDRGVGVIRIVVRVFPNVLPNHPAATAYMSERLMFLKKTLVRRVLHRARWRVAVIQSLRLVKLI